MIRLCKLIIILIAVSTDICHAQRIDTTIHKRHYSACSYYPAAYDRIQFDSDEPNILFSLGNYEDTVKTGHWLYFYPTGLLLAEGKYEKGIKTGKWNYYSGNGKFLVVTFYEKYPSIEKISFGPGNAPLISDVRIDEKYPKDLVNGQRRPGPTARILD